MRRVLFGELQHLLPILARQPIGDELHPRPADPRKAFSRDRQAFDLPCDLDKVIGFAAVEARLLADLLEKLLVAFLKALEQAAHSTKSSSRRAANRTARSNVSCFESVMISSLSSTLDVKVVLAATGCAASIA